MAWQTQLYLQADEPGVFRGLSGHYSGEGFSDMHFEMRAVPAEQFAAWVKTNQSTEGPTLDAASYAALARQSSKVPPMGVPFRRARPVPRHRHAEDRTRPGTLERIRLQASSLQRWSNKMLGQTDPGPQFRSLSRLAWSIRRRWRLRSPPSSPGFCDQRLPSLRRKEWLSSVDHKRIGVMYVVLAMVMLLRGFRRRRDDAAVNRPCTSRRWLPAARALQPDLLGARHDDDLLCWRCPSSSG